MLEPSRPPAPPRKARPRPRRRAAAAVHALRQRLLHAPARRSCSAAGGLAALLYHQFERPGPLERLARHRRCPKGEGRIEIATRLEKEGVISNRWTVHRELSSAESGFGPKTDGAEGRRVRDQEARQHGRHHRRADARRGVLSKVTIPEGLTSLQIVERCARRRISPATSPRSRRRARCCPTPTASPRAWTRRELLERMQAEDAALPRHRVGEAPARACPSRRRRRPSSSPPSSRRRPAAPDERDRVAARVHEPIAQGHAAAVRSDGDLRHRRRAGHARAAR